MFNKKKQKSKLNKKPNVKQQMQQAPSDHRDDNVQLPNYTEEKSQLMIMSHLGKALLTYTCEEDLSYNKYFIDNTPQGFQPIIDKLDIGDGPRIDKVIHSAETALNNTSVPLDYVEITSEYGGVSSEANDVEVTLL